LRFGDVSHRRLEKRPEAEVKALFVHCPQATAVSG
jgi:hypothetical protein